MKKLTITILFICITTVIYSQQFIWTTFEGTDEKTIAKRNVTTEVLKFYDLYDYYYDMTGYDKDTFIENFGDDWDWIYDVDTFTVFAMKIPVDTYHSAVYVIYISANSIDLIVLSDAYEYGATSTGSYRRQRFQTLINTLIK